MAFRRFLALAAVLAGVSQATADPIHAKDRALLEPITQARDATTTTALAKVLGKKRDESRNVGFGRTWMRYRLGGDSVSVWVDAVVFGQNVVGLRIRSLGGSEAWKQAAKKTLGPTTDVRSDGIDLRVRRAAARAAHQAEVHRVLKGPPRPAWGGKTDAVLMLSDPLADLTFGSSCYESGEAPRGREEAETLRRQGAVGSLGLVLMGLNPEGRVYAAQALLFLAREGEVVPATLTRAIQILRGLPGRVVTCDGCCVMDETASEIFARKDFLPAVTCRVLERTKEKGAWVDVRRITVYDDGTYTVRHRLLQPLPPDSRVLLRGTFPLGLLDRVRNALRKRRPNDADTAQPLFVISDGKAPPKMPEAIQRVRDAVPKER